MSLQLQPGEMEIFRAGDYPQGSYTDSDLSQIVADYNPVDEHKAFLGVRHRPEGQPQGRAYGFFESLRKAGSSIVAKFASSVPEQVKTALATGEANSWSSEFYTDYKGTGRKYLKAVKLLGDEPPAVKGLKAQLDFSEPDTGGVSVEITFGEPCPYIAATLAGRIKADETRRELNDLTWAFQDEVSRVLNHPDLDAATKRAEVNRLAAELSALTEAETETYSETGTAGASKGGSTVPTDPKIEAPAAVAPAAQPTVDFAEVQRENANLKAQLEKLEAEQAKTSRLMLRDRVETFAEAAKTNGKLLAGDFDAGVIEFAEALDGVSFTTGTGDAAKQHNARHWFEEFVGRRLAPVPLGRTEQGAAGARTGTDDRNAHQFSEDSVRLNAETEKYAKEHGVPYGEALSIVSRRVG